MLSRCCMVAILFIFLNYVLLLFLIVKLFISTRILGNSVQFSYFLPYL